MKNTIILSLVLIVTYFFIVKNTNNATSPSHRKLVLVGGGDLPDSIRNSFLNMAGGKDARLLVVPSASKLYADGYAKNIEFTEGWKNAGVASVEILHAKDRIEAVNPIFYGRIKLATGIWFSGGSQKHLAELYCGTPVINELKQLLNRGGVVGGTSAGASIVGKFMPYDDEEMEGFGLIDSFIIDQHFKTRSYRIDRLKKMVANHPNMLGIGIDDESAIIINDNKFTIIGDSGGGATVISSNDGEFGENNVTVASAN